MEAEDNRREEEGPAPLNNVRENERCLEECDEERESKPVRPEPPARPTGTVLENGVGRHAATLPDGCGDPDACLARTIAARRLGGAPLVEEPVNRRSGAAHVGAERACRAQRLDEGRGA